MEFRWVYVTVPSEEEAKKIGRAIVETGNAACANIFPSVTSFFRWDGKLEESNECVLVAKTCEKKLKALEKQIESLHSYDCPCIVALPIVEGNPAYLKWLAGALV